MHCFDGHHVTTLGELANKDNCPQEIQQLNSISHVMQEGRSKASDLKSNLKNLEAASVNLSQHFNNVQKKRCPIIFINIFGSIPDSFNDLINALFFGKFTITNDWNKAIWKSKGYRFNENNKLELVPPPSVFQ